MVSPIQELFHLVAGKNSLQRVRHDWATKLSLSSETTRNWERPFMGVWWKNPQISSSADGKFRPDYIPLRGSYPSYPPAYTRGLSPLSLFPRNLGPLDKTPRGTVGRSSDQSWGNLVHLWKQLCLGWKRRASLQFRDYRGSTFASWYFSLIGSTHSPDSSFRAWKRKKSSHLHWLQVWLSGATRTSCYLERKRPLDHPRVPNQIWWSNP